MVRRSCRRWLRHLATCSPQNEELVVATSYSKAFIPSGATKQIKIAWGWILSSKNKGPIMNPRLFQASQPQCHKHTTELTVAVSSSCFPRPLMQWLLIPRTNQLPHMETHQQKLGRAMSSIPGTLRKM